MTRGGMPGGCVSAATPEAAQCGAAVLEDGGNAVDAAVAVSLALGVTEPAGSGIGGQGTFIIHGRGETPLVINGTSRSPAATPPGATMADLAGHRASTVPTLLRVLDFAWRRFGSGRMSWNRLVEPAAALAEHGYRLGPFRHKALVKHAHDIRRSGVATRLLLARDGSVPGEGSLIRNDTLAGTLRRIAGAGAGDFYNGEIAAGIAEDMRLNEGLITLEDLRNTAEPPVLAPLSGTYRGMDVFTLPPPTAGWIVLLALNLLECAPEGELAVEGTERTTWLADVLNLAHRHRLLRPVADLVDYESIVSMKTGKKKARKLFRTLLRKASGETTHFSVADGSGMVVAVTQSLNAYYGAKTASPKLGFLYNNYMTEFVTGVERHPYALRPGAMPYSSMSATVLARVGEPLLALGSPGDERILSAVIQVISHWVDVGRGIEAAVAAARLHALRGEEILLEKNPHDEGTLLSLEERGYTIHHPLSSLFTGDLNPYFGGVHAVALENGRWVGAADPRRDGMAASVKGRA